MGINKRINSAMTTMYSGMGDDNSDQLAVAGSRLSSGSLDALSDDFGSLRISAPTTYNTNATTMDTQAQKQFKAYQVNDHFANSAFISHLQEGESEGESGSNSESVLEHGSESVLAHESDSALANDSVLEYGTVQRQGNPGNAPASAQFLPYMRHAPQEKRAPSPSMHGLTFSYEDDNAPGGSHDQSTAALPHPLTREPPSALIIKDIGELSGQVLNTFKKKNEQRERASDTSQLRNSHADSLSDIPNDSSVVDDHGESLSDLPNDSLVLHDHGESLSDLPNDSSVLHDHADSLSDPSQLHDHADSLSDDPALAAKEVYRNLLRSQGSLFNMKRGTGIPGPGHGPGHGHTRTVSNTVSTRGPPSSASIRLPSNPHLNELNLITPGSIGYRFKHSKGLWVPEEEAEAEAEGETETTTTMMMTTMQGDSHSHSHSHSNSNSNSNSHTHTASTFTMDESGDTSVGETTTPLIAPRVDRATVLGRVGRVQRATASEGESTSAGEIEDPSPLLSLLVQRVPASQPDWTRVHSVDLSGATSLRGLAQYLPQLVSLTATHSDIASLADVPPTVRTLDLSDGAVGDALGSLAPGNRVEQLVLARCRLRANLSVVASAPSLRAADLGGNAIVSLGGLGSAAVANLRLCDNALRGSVDMRRVVGANDNRLGGWLAVCELDLSGNAVGQVANIASLPALRTLCVRNNASCALEVCAGGGESGLRVLRLDGSPGVVLDLSGFPHLESLTVSGDAIVMGSHQFPATLRTLEIRGGDARGVAALLQRLPRDTRLETLSVEAIPQLQQLPCNTMTSLVELRIRDCGISSASALVRGLPYPNTIRTLDTRGNPLLQRHMRSGNNARFRAELEGVVREACPFLREFLQ